MAVKTKTAAFLNVDRAVMEQALELIMEIATGMIAHIDTQDGDPDLEPSLGYHPPDLDPRLVDAEGLPPTEPGRVKQTK